MHRASVLVRFREFPDGSLREVRGQAVDTLVRGGSEYLVVLSADGEAHALRLDLIDQIENQDTGETWRQNPDVVHCVT